MAGIAPRSLYVDKFIKGSSSDVASGYEDPTYLGFRLRFDFDGGHRNHETLLSEDPLFTGAGGEGDSAERYLRAIGMNNKADSIKEFKTRFSSLIKEHPYYLQSVEGLADFWKIPVGGEKGSEPFNNYRTAGKMLTFECLESIDLRMTALADLYRKATFDEKYMRALLPENLKWFSMTLDVAEIRNFHEVKNFLTASQSTQHEDFELKDLDNLISVLSFKFHKCEFDFDEAFPVRDVVSMQYDATPAVSKFKVRVGAMEERNYYTLLGYVLSSTEEHTKVSFGKKYDPNTNTSNRDLGNAQLGTRPQGYRNNSGVLGKVSQLGAEALNLAGDKAKEVVGAPQTYLSRGINSGSALATGGLLGNVYDFRNKSIVENITPFLNDKEMSAISLERQRSSSGENPPIKDVAYDAPRQQFPQGDLGKVYE